MPTINSSKSNQKFVINNHKEAEAHWPTAHQPFLRADLIDNFRLHWESHEKHIAEAIAGKLSAALGTKYVVRNIELSKDGMRRYNY